MQDFLVLLYEKERKRDIQGRTSWIGCFIGNNIGMIRKKAKIGKSMADKTH